jgi:hypothetical protein
MMAAAPPPPLSDTSDPVAEADAILQEAERAGVLLRATGGVAVALLSPSARRPPLRRGYQDIDFFGLSRDAEDLGAFFGGLGYAPEEEFNVLHGQRRLFFRAPHGRWEADVFLDRIEMCHQLDMRDRLAGHARTLSPADLLLSKLQVMDTNEKDLQDALALLGDHDFGENEGAISLERIDELCLNDWGWWRTATLVGGRVREAAERLSRGADAEVADTLAVAGRRLDTLLAHLDEAPKSRRWKMRARIGERKRWYETPEDIEHEEQGA